MTSPEERIRELVRARGIGGAEAEDLLAAVRPKTPSTRNPFERWSGEVTSLVGVLVAIVSIAASRLHVRFDGALDMHVGTAPVPIAIALADQLAAVPMTALVMWAAGRLAGARGARFVDVLGVIGASRLPIALLAFPIALVSPHVSHDPTKPNAAVLVLALFALAGVVAQIVLLVAGFRTTTALRGGRLAATFVAGLVAAEVLTKIFLALVTH